MAASTHARFSKLLYNCISSSNILSRPVQSHNFSTLLQKRRVVLFSANSIRFNSTKTDAVNSNVVNNTASGTNPADIQGYIPDAPIPPVEGPAETVLNALGEPALQSLGLANWTPSGFVQWGLESLHAGLDIPWWSSIVIGTICVRVAMFPLVIKAQKHTAHMHNNMPTMTRLQDKFSKARLMGDQVAASRAAKELLDFMKNNEVKPLRGMLVPLAQLPVFLSVFVGVRQMANLPVESLKTGGIFWFTDLTVVDPFYALPFLTCATLMATIELGVDGVKSTALNPKMRMIMRAMPIFVFPFIINFPTAMLCYWFTSNTVSLFQVLFLKIPQVRQFFSIPIMVKHENSGIPKKKFMEGFKESLKNSKVAAQIEDRQRVDSINFKEAGLAPIQKTYSYDPTKGKKIDKKK